jgi:glycosyltransferase involved in cell wall biosynthesis
MWIVEVLLISPKDPKVPSNLKFLMGGESTYTESLLSDPPRQVVYTHHSEALKNGDISYTFLQKVLSYLIKFRVLPMDSGYHCITLHKRFDLIYCHGYNLKLTGLIKPPVVLGDSSSNYLFLKDYLGWSEIRIRFQYALRKKLHIYLGVFDRDLNLQNCFRLIVFSEFAKNIHISLGADKNKIAVIYPGISIKRLKHKKQNKILNILFVGVWFERKGGMILMQAYKILKKKYPSIHLTILGPLPNGVSMNRKEITQIAFVSYDRLLKDFYPVADIFVLVPPKVEGFGMVTVEAMSYGIPVVVSDVCALSEIVEDGKTGLVIKPADVGALTIALEKLIINKKLREQMGENGRARFMQKFTTEAMNKQLLSIFHGALH